MQIVEYENKYLEDVKDLLVELEEYIVSIDKNHLNQVHPEYREKMAVLDLAEVNKNNGKCYLAVENNKADRKSTRLNSSHPLSSRMPSSA